MKITVKYGKCHIHVEGMELKCPICGVLVKSGETHDCEEKEAHEKRILKGSAAKGSDSNA